MHPRRVASRYLLSGLARCGHCGKALIGQDAKSGRFTYYVCGTITQKGSGSCPSRYLNSRQFEKLVIDKIKEHGLTTENLTKLVKIVNEEIDGLAVEYRDRLDSIIADINDVERRLGKPYDAIETGKFELDELSRRIQELRLRQSQLHTMKQQLEEELSARKLELADEIKVTSCVKDLRN